ncbi:MAG: SprT family zinc-dependent metalloprotease [Halothiobacillaceae bacterium]
MGVWPPPCSVRISARAKRVLLRFHPEKGLEIVSPTRLSTCQVNDVLEHHRAWIERHLQKLRAWPKDGLPESIDLPAVGQHWHLTHVPGMPSGRLHADAQRQHLTLHGSPALLWPLLGRWLLHQAKLHLPPRLLEHARQHGLQPSGVNVRWARSRWGSCSHQGRISLNARLLWLSPQEVDYVLLHELTHLEHFNHSPAFWQALEARCPGARQWHQRLRKTSACLPGWLPRIQ